MNLGTIFLIALPLGACQHLPAGSQPTPHAKAIPGDPHVLRQRESHEPFASHTVATRFGRFQVQARQTSPVTEDGPVDAWTMDIGTLQPMQCQALRTDYSPARLIKAAIDHTLQNSPNALKSQGLENIAWSHLGDVPTVRLTWKYTATLQGRLAQGWMKIAAINYDEVSVACWHDEPGYQATFERVMRDSFTTPTDIPVAHPVAATRIGTYTHSETSYLQGSRTTRVYNSDKSHQVKTTDSYLILHDPKGKRWEVKDMVRFASSNAERRVETMQLLETRNDELHTDASIWRDPSHHDRAYRLEGENDGDALDAQLDACMDFEDEEKVMQRLSDAANDKDVTLTWIEVFPGAEIFGEMILEPGDIASKRKVRPAGAFSEGYTIEFDDQRRPCKYVWESGLQLDMVYNSQSS